MAKTSAYTHPRVSWLSFLSCLSYWPAGS